tara:strand:- start:260 stop:523 length:264 start_codon:yes stop_codon:yes gene_type:complete
MKITKRQLKKIIKEEKAKLLKENMAPSNTADLAEDAAHAALAYIQAEMGIRFGDNAGMYWSGPEWDQLTAMLEDYIKYEIKTEYGGM